jgi:hypothetical protein
MLRRVVLVINDVSDERIASIIRVKRIGKLGRTFVFLRRVLRLLVSANAVPRSPILATLMMEALRSSETSVLTRARWRNIPEDASLEASFTIIDVTKNWYQSNLNSIPAKPSTIRHEKYAPPPGALYRLI